jgi:hypothetical protein
MSYAYQWKRGGVNISGATANTYTLVTADLGAMITATVTATNAAGSASATAAGVGPVTAGSSTTLQAQAGSFAFAGQSATLTPPVGGGALSIQAQAGAFAVSGESMEIVISYVAQVDAGAFALAGKSATLTFTPVSAGATFAFSNSGNFDGSGFVHTLSCDLGAVGADRRIIVITEIGFAADVTSITVNDGTTDVALTRRAVNLDTGNDGSIFVYDGIVAAGASFRDVKVTSTVSAYRERDMFVWVARGLSTGHVSSAAPLTTTPAGFPVNQSDFLFCVTRGNRGAYATSSELPDAFRTSGSVGGAAEWTIDTTTVSFLVRPNIGGISAIAYAQYR